MQTIRKENLLLLWPEFICHGQDNAGLKSFPTCQI